jgi:DnaK suppressor protein
MKKDDKMKKKEVVKFKERLEKMRDHLIKKIKGTVEGVKASEDSKGYSQHQADEGTDDFDRTTHLHLTDKEMQDIRHIERALEKIEENTYSVCDVSGEIIPLARLEAVPYANVTVEVQSKVEKGLL